MTATANNRAAFAVRGNATIYHGDSAAVLRDLPANSIGSCVTDPPYHLGDTRPQQRGYPQRDDSGAWDDAGRKRAESSGGFMGMKWDGGDIAFTPEFWRELFRVLKPGAYVVAFSGTRTYHRLVAAIEAAGFVIRDMLHWSYGSGFPKSHDISKAIDKEAGAKRGKKRLTGVHNNKGAVDTRPFIERAKAAGFHEVDDDTPITDAAREWQGYGTALKPGHEPICLAQKPYEGTYAANVQRWGVGALNIDRCRIPAPDSLRAQGADESDSQDLGRWPANQLLTHSLFCIPSGCDPSCPVGQMDKQAGIRKSRKDGATGKRGTRPYPGVAGTPNGDPVPNGPIYGDTGGASRFFTVIDWSPEEIDYWGFRYVPKPHEREKDAGTIDPTTGEGGNPHVTVKPIALMGWLIDLVCPPGQTVIDPFAGSFSTLCAARQRGRPSIGIDLELAHCETGAQRLGANTIKGWADD